MRAIFLSLALLLSLNLAAQQTAVITGTVNSAVWKEISVEINRIYLDNTTVTESTDLNDNNNFSFELEINIPQLVILEYARNRTTIYIEPGGDLNIVFDANSFRHSMEFSGSCGHNNIFLQQFSRRFPEETNQFAMKQLKKGIVYYKTDEPLEKKMKTLGPGAFTREMGEMRMSKQFMVDQYERNHHGSLTPLFKNFILAEIDYDWAFKMMMYGYSFQNLHNIPESFFEFTQKVNIQNDDALGNDKYRTFLVGYINMVFDKSRHTANPYIGQYEMAKDLVTDASLAFFQADILVRGLRKNELATMLPTYKEFVKNVPYNEFYLRAVDAYFQKKQYAIGTAAPDFTLKDATGNMVSLNDFQGKFIVLNFWASWCRPCINKIEAAKTVYRDLQTADVVFVNVSLERNQERFFEEITKRNLGSMVNIYAEHGLSSTITLDYDVKAIPEFYIISKEGTFARKPEKTDPYTLRTHLRRLLAR